MRNGRDGRGVCEHPTPKPARIHCSTLHWNQLRPVKLVGSASAHGKARHGRAAPVDGAPALAALGPGDAAQGRQEVDRLVVLRLDHYLPRGIDQTSFAVPEKGQEAEF
jgi:hypothetical protein